MSGLVLIYLRDTPESLGLHPVEYWKKEKVTVTFKKKEYSAKELIQICLREKYLLFAGFGSFFCQILRYIPTFWILQLINDKLDIGKVSNIHWLPYSLFEW
jgi:sugar phosphate permease